jgi:hypothetical protein
MEIAHGKKFEKPQPGNYTGTVIDVVTLPNVSSTFNGVTKLENKIRVVWVVGPSYPGQVVTTKEGKPFEVIGTYNAKLIEKPKKSKLWELLEQMLQAAPPLVKNDEELEQLMLGRSNQLFLIASPNPSDPADPYINIAGLMPLAPNQVAPKAPEGFIRKKFRSVTQAGPQGQSVQTYATPQAAAAAQPQAPVTPATNQNIKW